MRTEPLSSSADITAATKVINMSDEFAWLDEPAPEKRRAKKSARKAVKVAPGKKIDHEPLRGRVMFQAVKGRKRIWACDGQWVFFRRKSCYGTTPDGRQETNHTAIHRHEKFLAQGDYTYVETQDDVEICKVNPQSPFFRKGVYLGELADGQVRRQVELAACKRDWVLYADALEELAGRIKNYGYTESHAKLIYNEHLVYIEVMIAQRGGPTPAECAAGLAQVRQRRGVGSGRVVLLPS